MKGCRGAYNGKKQEAGCTGIRLSAEYVGRNRRLAAV